ncbi:MAG: peptidoglycan DD-metalloendopeptidase family protein [Prochloraceae cyanobacterium]
MKELTNKRSKSTNDSESKYLDASHNCLEALADIKELDTSAGGRKVRQAAATIGLAISMGAAGIALDKEGKAIAAEAITTKPTFTNLSQKNTGNNSSLTSGKLTVKSSANRINATTPTAPVLVHKIKHRETIVSISAEYDIDPETLAAYNQLTKNRVLEPGKILKIPVNPGIVSHSNPEDSPRARDIERLKNSQKLLQKSLSKLQLRQSEQKSRKPILLTKNLPSSTKESENSQTTLEAVKGKIIYKVREGDTLGAIAILHGVSITQLVRENKITNPNSIEVDRELIITLEESKPEASSSNRYLTSRSTVADRKPIVLQTTRNQISENTSAAENSQPEERVELQREQTNTEQVNPYVEKLRADIERLRSGYQASETSKPVQDSSNLRAIESNRDVSVSERLSDPDWLKKRLQSRNLQAKTLSVNSQTENRQTPQLKSTEALPHSQNLGGSKLQPQLVNSQDSERVNLGKTLKVSVAERVSPELPPLPTADQFLPNIVDNAPTTVAAAKFTGYRWPAKGIITSGYGWRWGRLHKGVDIAGPVGTPIFAAAPGKVISAGWNSGGYGNLVKIRHYDGSTTLYAHNSSLLVRRGQSVSQGQMIARMGSTGFSTGPHLHFEIHKGHRGAVNPMAYLPRKR